MADISVIKLPDSSSYNLKDAQAVANANFSGHELTLNKRGGATQVVDMEEFDSLNVTDMNVGNLIVTGAGRFTNGIFGDLIGNVTGNVSGTSSGVLDANNNSSKTTFAYSKAGLSANWTTSPWFAAWNGYELRAISVANMKTTLGLNNVNNTADANKSVATATKFTSAQSITLSGDVTGTASSQAGWNITATLADSGVTADSYGPSANASPTHGGTFSVPYITVDAKGRITTASTKTITLPADSNTHNTAYLYAGTSTGEANATTTSGNTYLILKDASTVSRVKLVPSSNMSIVSDANGNVTFTATNTNTWRSVKLEGTEILGTATSTNALNFKKGTNINITNSSGTLTFSATDTNTTYTLASGDANGQIKVTPSEGDAYNVDVKGLGSAAYTASTAYAPAEHEHSAADITSGTLGVGRGGTGATTFTTGALLIGNGANAIGTRAIKNMTSVNDLEWTSSTTDVTIPTVNTIAYWNGRYNSSSSNLAYCNKGAFGTIVTASADAYVLKTGGAFTGGVTGTSFGASSYLAANTGNSGTAGGIALYNTNPTDYGIAMRSISNGGAHGYVTVDWSTFFYMSGANATNSLSRGWTFKNVNTGNVASISGAGNAVFNGSVTVGGNATNTSGCELVLNEDTQSLDFVWK